MTTRLLPLSEYAIAARFLDQYWAKGHIYTRDRRLFDWTFRRPGFCENGTYSFAIAEEGGEVCGVLGGIPFLFNARGVTRRGYWLANWKVRPEYRHGAAALQLLDYFHRPPEIVTISFGINTTVAKLYRAMRWHVIDDAPRYLAVVPGAVSRWGGVIRMANESWERGRCDGLAAAFVATAQPVSAAEVLDSPPDWDDWDRHTWAQLKPELMGPVRDSAYLKWRYTEHPSFRYRFIRLCEGERTGLLVWRLESIRRRNSAGGLDEVEKIGRLVEFLPVSEANALALAACFMSTLEQAGACAADCYLYNGQFGRWLQRAGFHRVDSQPDAAGIPCRFQPLDASGGRIMSAVSVRQPPFPQYPFDAGCAWYWTKSDSDQDRPN